MSVTRTPNGKKWRARFPVGGGQYKTLDFAKKVDAEAKEREMKDLVRGGGSFDASGAKRRLVDFAWSWYEDQLDTPNYRQNISSHIRNHIGPFFKDQAVGSVTEADLQRFVRALEKKGIAATSVVTIAGTAKMILRAAVRRKVLMADPTLKVTLPKVDVRELKPLTIPQVNLIAAEIFPRYRALVLFTAGTGLRQGEAFGVKVSDIVWEPGEGAVTVRRQIQSYTGAPQEEQSTKTRRDRTVPIDDNVLELLRAHLTEYPPGDDGFIFTNSLGRPLHRRVFDRAFVAAKNRAAKKYRAAAAEVFEETGDHIALAQANAFADEIVSAVFHSLRHFYASLLARMGLSPKVVAARLGHANVTMTLTRYSHLWADDGHRTREATGALFAA